MKPAAAIGFGVVAGAAGTALMTAYQEGIARATGSGDGGSKEPRTWAEAPAPAQLVKKVSEGAFGHRIVKRQAPMITNAVHWTYGTALGAAYGVLQSRLRMHPLLHGPLFGTAVWGLGYATLAPLGIYEPPWESPPKTLAKDWSYHAVYGLGVASVFDALSEL